MELKGKKIAFLGDSITEGHGVEDKESNIYWQRIGKMTGAEVYGYGIGGTRIADQLFPSINPKHDLHFIPRVDEMIDDADVVVVFGGTNDFGHGDAPLGHMDDRTDETFYGACHVLLEKLINKYPEAQIVLMTPLHREIEDEDGRNAKGIRRAGTLADYVQIERRVAQYYGIPVVDLFATCMMQPKVPVLKEKYMPDGLHPNDAGHALIANRLLGVLKVL